MKVEKIGFKPKVSPEEDLESYLQETRLHLLQTCGDN